MRYTSYQSPYERTRRSLLPFALLHLAVAALLCLPFRACADGLLQKGDVSHPIPAFQVQTTAGALVNGDALVMHFIQGATVLTGTGTFAQPDTTNQPGAEVYTFTTVDMTGLGYGYVLCQPVDTTTPANVINPYLVNLVAVNIYDATRLGLTALPNAAPGTVGGLQVPIVASGTSPGGNTSTTFVMAAGASTTSGIYVGNVLRIIGAGTGAGQSRVVTGYNGATLTDTLSRPWTVTPDATSQYSLVDDPHPALDGALAVTLPSTAPTGYGGSTGDTSGVTTLLLRVPGTVQPQTGDAYAQGVTNAAILAAHTSALATANTGITNANTGITNANTSVAGVPAAVLSRSLGHGMTVGQLLVLLQASNAAGVSNTWNATTHTLTTVYQFAGDAGPTRTDATVYPSTQVVAPPVQGRATTTGTIPQP